MEENPEEQCRAAYLKKINYNLASKQKEQPINLVHLMLVSYTERIIE